MSHGNDLSKHNRRKDAPTKHTYHRAPPFEVIRHLPTFLGLLCDVYDRPLSSTQAWGSSRSSSSAAGAAPSTRDASRAKTILRDAKLIGSVIGAVSTRCAYPRPTRETRLHFLRPRRPQDLGRACMAEVDSRAFLRHPPAMGFDFESISDLIDRFRTHSERELESS